MCLKNEIEEIPKKPVHCWRCGRYIYEDVRTGKTGCRNTKCKGYLIGSKWLSMEFLRQLKL